MIWVAALQNICIVLNETINTAQETINNAQQTIQTAQKRITDNINAATSPSPPYLVGTYTPPSPPYNPNANEGEEGESSPDFNTWAGEQNLEKQNTVIKKEGSSTEDKDAEEGSKDKSIEKVGDGEIMIDSLPTLTNIFNTIVKRD